MQKTLVICLAFWLVVMPVIAKDKAAIVPLGNWRGVESLEKDTSIMLRMDFGDRIEGKFLGLDAEAIRLEIDAQEKVYPRSAVAEVWQIRVPDGLLNGTLIGMAVGAAGGIATGIFLAAMSDHAGSWIPLSVVLGVGTGSAIGAATDSAIKGNRLLYRK